MSDTDILNVDHLSMRFGGIVAVNNLSFSAQRGKITALIELLESRVPTIVESQASYDARNQ